jgi:apolipoprotein N-acyltransferase
MRQMDERRASAKTAKIALVQPSIPATVRWDPARAPWILDRLTVLTKAAEARGAELVVWPESAYPYRIAHASRRSPIGVWAPLQMEVHGPVLMGLMMSASGGDAYNAATIASANGVLSEPYDKRHLLWFGEKVPFGEQIPWLKKTFARGGGLLAGERNVVQRAGDVRASVLNCFEDTLPDAGREAMEGSPNLLVNVTNDGWFVGSGESELHLRISVMRAIELRRDFVRAVNFGPTSFVDAAGRIRKKYDGEGPLALDVEPVLLSGSTIYAQAGDAPWLILLGAGLVFRLTKNRKGTAIPQRPSV